MKATCQNASEDTALNIRGYLSGKAMAGEFFGTFAVCQAISIPLCFYAMASDLLPRSSGWAAFNASLFGPYLIFHLPFLAVSIRRSRDTGIWPILLFVPGVIALPCILFALAGVAAIIAPNHPPYYWQKIGGLAFTGFASLIAFVTLGNHPSKLTASNTTRPLEVSP